MLRVAHACGLGPPLRSDTESEPVLARQRVADPVAAGLREVEQGWKQRDGHGGARPHVDALEPEQGLPENGNWSHHRIASTDQHSIRMATKWSMAHGACKAA